ncbi:uncharacterized protein LOC105828129 [Monomorium pharaonis]|uniref:uncharacterized protein LOC105828129 n=1 Tax=Monomorium pharaonis TaxID=307658 RepID=UPI00063FD0D2|nr:uncharacterized protein LOC105828129 [Monomorium pharaonis]XP_028048508.1 uncharacterized protein LOC105828129 [Monomorium pharaonis]
MKLVDMEKKIKPYEVLKELQKCQDDIPILRKLIASLFLLDSAKTSTTEWQMVLAHIMEIISNNNELGNERVLLASHALYTVFPTQYSSNFFRDAITFQDLSTENTFYFCRKLYIVSDPELFKLVHAYGYLQVNLNYIFDSMVSEYRIFFVLFKVIYRNCITYTKYTYFAYKVLSMWLKKFIRMYDETFRDEYNSFMERKLEAIIFSNWSNVLNLCKQNAEIFKIYLQLMSEKYDKTFVDHVYHICLKDMSWQNETKYVILAEIVQVHDMEIQELIEKGFLFDLCNSLTKNSLRCGGTKLYLAILKRLRNGTEWEIIFGDVMRSIIFRWESGTYEDHNAIQSLIKYWLEPTVEKYRNVLFFLWDLCKDLQGYFFLSHLVRLGAKIHKLEEMLERKSYFDVLTSYINDKEEIIRLNAFAAFCYHAVALIDAEDREDPFHLIKEFLWFNANTATILMREGIIKYFWILCSNILKAINVKGNCMKSVFELMEWLHEYFLDCFEIGSCYQRKILALNLYKTLLSFTNKNLHKSYTHKKNSFCYNTVVDKYLKTTDNWKFINKESLFLLLRLVLDSALDVRQLAATLILEYFEKDTLSTREKQILYNCAWEHCNSSKFYKIESGATLLKIMAHWLPLNEIFEDVAGLFSKDEHIVLVYSSYSEFLLNEAKKQLGQMKSDILKAIVKNTPFYGMLTALLAIAFRGGPEKSILQLKFTEEILCLLGNANDFFLSTFSTKSSNTVCPSSFAEMGLAIDEKIKTSEIEDFDHDELQLSSAHQVLISCIWMSLKTLCEIASEIGMLMQSHKHVQFSMNIIVTVLQNCRHKGVVECAGAAIANLSRRLYNSKEYSKLPKTYLMDLLNKDEEESLSLTRRGAGLTIMFHKLVVSDDRRNRPIVHFAIQTLLDSLDSKNKEKQLSASSEMAVFNSLENEEKQPSSLESVETGKDSPLARRLHFLRALVADKEIHAHLVSYMEEICLTCFKYMQSDVWIIRNASLQLYGAVMPRLVGQCTEKSDETFNFGDGYSVNHFVMHYPKLTSHVWKQLREVSEKCGTSNATLRCYAGVMPILTMLSKLSMSGCDLVDYPAKMFTVKVKCLLLVFLGNPMIHVRQLAAKAYVALTPLNAFDIYSELDIIRNKAISSKVNMSHGYMLTYGYLRERYNYVTRNLYSNGKTRNCVEFCWTAKDKFGESRYNYILDMWQNIRNKCKNATHPCYILETLFLREFNCTQFGCRVLFHDNLADIKHIMPSLKIQPGFFQFIEFLEQLHMRFYKSTIESKLKSDDCKQIGNVLNSICIEQSIGLLKGLSYCVPLLEFVLEYLMSIKGNRHQLLLDEIVAFTLGTIKKATLPLIIRDEKNKVEEFKKVEFDERLIKKFVEAKIFAITKSSVIRMKNSLILALSSDETLINRVLSYVYDICMDEKQSVRLIAAEYIEIAMNRFILPMDNNNQLLAKKCCLILLKDEIAEIREIAWKSYKMYDYTHQLLHKEIMYQWLLFDVIYHQSANDNVNFVHYFTFPDSCALRDGDFNRTIENPFHHNDSVFYKEESKFLNLCFLHDPSSNESDIYKNSSIIIRAIQTRHFRKLQEEAGYSYNDLRVILNLKEIDYITQKRNIIIQQWR